MPTSTADPWHALSDPTRRRVLARVAQAPSSVTEIARGLPVSRPAVSQHLRVLLDARLVYVRREGREHVYRPRPEGLEQLRQELETFWAQTLTHLKTVAEQTYLGPPGSQGDPT
ncbi:ArsR/SmtB family transcription factor [Mumia quercus]|uniref:ArsR/SmtB family transcription factor n=1 Tax=Mumia quercus TaxID=2976125 RepID=UPI0021D0933D|nr:metalloregulator ArsR/SmtB family transcription factor [Mumia quercus]